MIVFGNGKSVCSSLAAEPCHVNRTWRTWGTASGWRVVTPPILISIETLHNPSALSAARSSARLPGSKPTTRLGVQQVRVPRVDFGSSSRLLYDNVHPGYMHLVANHQAMAVQRILHVVRSNRVDAKYSGRRAKPHRQRKAKLACTPVFETEFARFHIRHICDVIHKEDARFRCRNAAQIPIKFPNRAGRWSFCRRSCQTWNHRHEVGGVVLDQHDFVNPVDHQIDPRIVHVQR